MRFTVQESGAAMALAAACGLQAAVIRGVVLDHETGRPLARTLVTLQVVQGYAGGERSVRAGSAGQFVFSPVGAGMYLLRASRAGFAPYQYGQKDWGAAAAPIVVQDNEAPFLELRMKRLGSISGVIWDENEIGIPDQDVVAYQATRPPQIAERAKTDDRGAFRIHGLEPGSYYVRSAPKELEDGTGLLPTFYKDTALSLDEARTVDVYLEQQTPDVTIKPAPGRLVRLGGTVYQYPPVPMTVTLASDMGRRSTGTDANGRFSFDPLAPGPYEIYTQTNGLSEMASSAYEKLSIERDNDALRLQSHRSAEVRMAFEDREGGKPDPAAFTVLARRVDLAGPGPASKLPLHSKVPDGRWEAAIIPPPYYYAVSISGCGRTGNEPGRADGWNEFRVQGGGCELKVTLSSHPASVRGRVTASGSDAAPGAPVYLEPYDPDTGKRAGDLRAARTDARGAFQLPGLAPGTYRLLSTFDYDNPDERAFENATLVTLTEGHETTQDLALR